MKIVSKQQALAYLRQQKMPIEVLRAFGDYQQDANVGQRTNDVYDESQVFYAGGGNDGGVGVQMVTPPIIKNNMSFTLYPFRLNIASNVVVQANPKRTFLMVQNQSVAGGGVATDLFFNFTSGAGPNNGVLLSDGQGVFFDIVCPNNAITCAFNSNTAAQGIVVEGAPTF